MRLATLVIITRMRGGVEEILVARKKTGEIGVGKFSAPGGKLDEGETLRQCASRESFEEVRIVIPEEGKRLTEVSVLDVFTATGEEAFEHFMRVFVYRTDEFLGEPVETEDMEQPIWVPFNEIPYDEMYPGDERWLPFVLDGTATNIHFSIYRRKDQLMFVQMQPLLSFDELMQP